MMRALLLSLLALVGCGNGMDPSSGCLMIEQQLLAIAEANQSCTQDSDCHFVYQISDVHTPGCDVFTNAAGQAQMTSLAQQYVAAGCRTGCLALMGKCHMGVCGGPTP
jgi:hypothetical protein